MTTILHHCHCHASSCSQVWVSSHRVAKKRKDPLLHGEMREGVMRCISREQMVCSTPPMTIKMGYLPIFHHCTHSKICNYPQNGHQMTVPTTFLLPSNGELQQQLEAARCHLDDVEPDGQVSTSISKMRHHPNGLLTAISSLDPCVLKELHCHHELSFLCHSAAGSTNDTNGCHLRQAFSPETSTLVVV